MGPASRRKNRDIEISIRRGQRLSIFPKVTDSVITHITQLTSCDYKLRTNLCAAALAMFAYIRLVSTPKKLSV